MNVRSAVLVAALAFAAPVASTEVPLDPALIATLPKVSGGGNVHGKYVQCEGVALAALLQASKAMPAEPLRGAQLARAVVVSARDGYRVVFSLGELDSSLGGTGAILSNRCNGAPLDAQDGPWRLIVPGESRPARWIRQIESIQVVDLKETH